MDVWLTETYFDRLRSDCFSDPRERNLYDGCLRLLHEIPFYYTMWSDENRAGDALAYRRNDFLGFQEGLETMDQRWLEQWAQAAPSVLEVLLGIARRWNMYFEQPVAFYFAHLFHNLGLHHHPGRTLNTRNKEMVRARVDVWMSRQFEPNGYGSPFPIHQAHMIEDQRTIDIWGQMNAYSAEHFQ